MKKSTSVLSMIVVSACLSYILHLYISLNSPLCSLIHHNPVFFLVSNGAGISCLEIQYDRFRKGDDRTWQVYLKDVKDVFSNFHEHYFRRTYLICFTKIKFSEFCQKDIFTCCHVVYC